MNDICFELSSSWQSDFDTTPIKLQRIRHRQRLPPLFLRKLRSKVRENVRQVANAYRSKHMRALSRPAVIQTCLSSSATPILIRPEELRIGLLGSYQVFQLFEAHKRPVFKDLFRHVNPLEQIIKLFCSARVDTLSRTKTQSGVEITLNIIKLWQQTASTQRWRRGGY